MFRINQLNVKSSYSIFVICNAIILRHLLVVYVMIFPLWRGLLALLAQRPTVRTVPLAREYRTVLVYSVFNAL